MYDPLGAPSVTDSRYDPDKVAFRGGPLGESKKILRLYARDRRREKMWRILLAIKFRYIFIPLIAIIAVQAIELNNIEYGTGPISMWQLSPAEYDWNAKVKTFVVTKTKILDVKCPKDGMTGIETKQWDSYNQRNHRKPFDQAGPGCTIR